MSDEDFEEEPELDDEDIDEDDLADDDIPDDLDEDVVDVEDDEDVETIDLDLDADIDTEIPVATVVAPKRPPRKRTRRTTSSTSTKSCTPTTSRHRSMPSSRSGRRARPLEDDEEELEEEEGDADDRGDGPTRIVPRRPASSLPVVFPRAPRGTSSRTSEKDLCRDCGKRTRPPAPDPRLPGAVAAVVAGLLLGVSFPPLDLGALALVAVIPLLWAWRGATPRRAALYGFVFGLAFFGVLLVWSRYFGAVAIAPLVIAEAAYLAGAGALVAVFERRGMRSPPIVAAVWVVVETLRGRWPSAGSRGASSVSRCTTSTCARALASFGGVALVSFLIVCFDELLLDGVLAPGAARSAAPGPTPGLRTVAVMLAGILVIVALADVLRYEPTVTGHIKFALLQGNDQDRNLTQQEIDADYLTNKHLALAATLHGHYDLIVFPESSLENDPTADSGAAVPARRGRRRARGGRPRQRASTVPGAHGGDTPPLQRQRRVQPRREVPGRLREAAPGPVR